MQPAQAIADEIEAYAKALGFECLRKPVATDASAIYLQIGPPDEPPFNYTIIRVSDAARSDNARPFIHAEIGGHLRTDASRAKYHSDDWKQAVDWVLSIVREED
ncbi:hypothetical protein BH10PSE7_BH10PSE7_37890 [soil metagenome]